MGTPTTDQRVYNLERRSGMKQEGACGLYLGSGSNCGKQAGHADRGDANHLSALDPNFVPWGPDWQDPITGLSPVSDGRAAVAMLRGFARGITNDPPDNCPDLPFDGDTIGDYSTGTRLGGQLRRAGHGIDLSSTLIVRGCPDGTEVTCVPEVIGVDEKPDNFRKDATPLRRAIGSPANWRIYVPSMLVKNPGDCPFIAIGVEANSEIVVDFSSGTPDLQCTYGVGPFKPSETP